VEFLPEPAPRPRPLKIISVDDHVVEPPTIFEGRLPKKFASEAPRVVETEDGAQAWLLEGELNRHVGIAAVAGRPRSTTQYQASRFEHMIPSCYLPSARVRDMDIGGVDAAVVFPSALPGFGGSRFCELENQELGLALVRAWNDWLLEEWIEPYPDRFIPCQLTWLNDVEVAAAEIRANAERGYKAVSFSEAPHKLGLPSFHTGYWDPFLAACEETETVINLHTGSASFIHLTADDAPYDEIPVMFPMSGMFATVDVLYARIPLRFPRIKFALSEGGIGWVPALVDRLEHLGRHFEYLERLWPNEEGLTPLDLLRRNFWYCALDERAGFATIPHIGMSKQVMVEVDFPHEDSTWPDTQKLLADQLSALTPDEIDDITYRNAAKLYRHEISRVDTGPAVLVG
jgi:predicted TIM-barrel fold metal-dependent hydrolase